MKKQDITTESGKLTIDLNALADNYRTFQSITSESCAVAGVIKANAYGLGASYVFNTLKKLGCPQFFVATLDEALTLRKHDKETPLAVLGGLFTGAENEYIHYNILPVLNSLEDVERWTKMARQKQEKLPALLHFDTAMNRLGLGTDETQILLNNLSLLDGLDVQLIMSHFACADEKDHPLTQAQAKKFADIAQHFPNAKKSLANSSGLFSDKAYHYDLVRPGYALYGGNPTPHTANPVKPVISLNIRVLQVRNAQKNETIGYGASHKFDKKTQVATLALGYADGFLRALSGKAKLYYNGMPCDVLGRVSMDLTSIDVSHIPNIKQGDWVEILGPHQSVDDLADAAGTIGYEILTSLSQRYKRHYIGI